MNADSGYWTNRAVSRRKALRGAAVAGGGLAVASLAACSGRGSSNKGAGAKVQTSPQALDSAQGKPGGKFVYQAQSTTPGLGMVKSNNGTLAQLAGFTHSGLLEFKNGTPGVDGTDTSVQPDLARTVPEQPDSLTYVYKLKDARFHNGRTVTSEDVKYSYDRYAAWDGSAFKTLWAWLDRVETPDPKTAVVKAKAPFADGLTAMAARTDAFILAREHEEGPDADKKLMGSGPFIFVDYTPPVVTRFRKNPDFYDKPYPYFETLEALGTSDDAKRIADYVSHQVHLTYFFNEENRDQIKRSRADAKDWPYPYGSHQLFIRTDQPPFNDKRVRQALSMSIDRKAIRDATSKGEGEPDQVLSWTNKFWGFRKPAQLGASAKYWNYDPAEAKKLLAAAGITQPIELTFTHNDATFLGQGFADTAILTQTQWKTLGVANSKDVVTTPAQASSTTGIGNYDGVYLGANQLANSPTIGIYARGQFFSLPEGVKAPTPNTGHINDPQLSALVDKQLTQLNLEERKQTLRQIEDLLADQQYRLCYSSYGGIYFSDPTLRNLQVPKFFFSGSIGYIKYWWFAQSA